MPEHEAKDNRPRRIRVFGPQYIEGTEVISLAGELLEHIQEHERILQALQNRDKETMHAAVRHHLKNTQSYLLRLVDENSAIKYIIK